MAFNLASKSVFVTRLVISGILFSTAVVAKPLTSGILFSTAVNVNFVAKLSGSLFLTVVKQIF